MVRRLRQRLARYYAGEGAWAAIEIELPDGSYQPRFLRRGQDGGAKLPSTAVLPFLDLTGNPSLEAFCDAVSNEITDALARLPGVKIVARTSAFRFRGVVADARTIGQALGVATLLEGSVQIGAGAALKIAVQWVTAVDGFHAWARTTAATPGEADAAFRERVAREIVAGLQRRLLKGGPLPLAAASVGPARRSSSGLGEAHALSGFIGCAFDRDWPRAEGSPSCTASAAGCAGPADPRQADSTGRRAAGTQSPPASARRRWRARGSAAVAGASLHFTLGAQSCNGSTSASGVASCSIMPSSAGQLVLSASYAGSSVYTSAVASQSRSPCSRGEPPVRRRIRRRARSARPIARAPAPRRRHRIRRRHLAQAPPRKRFRRWSVRARSFSLGCWHCSPSPRCAARITGPGAGDRGDRRCAVVRRSKKSPGIAAGARLYHLGGGK